MSPVTASQPIAHLVPNRSFTYSLGPQMIRSTLNQVNNEGFVNPQDYLEGADSPLLAIIGDSYVEALMVPHGETLQGRLQEKVGSQGRIYSFAISGAPLSQYLAWAEYARNKFRADGLAFVVVSNDFDQSLIAFNARNGYHFFEGDLDACQLSSVRLDHRPSALRPFLQNSAFLQYLVFNLQVLSNPVLTSLLASLRSALSEKTEPKVARQTSSQVDLKEKGAKCAITFFLDELVDKIDLPPERMIFLMDGWRSYKNYSPTWVKETPFGRLRSHFIHEAKKRGMGIIDLDPLFLKGHRSTGEMYGFAEDPHWNEAAHEVAANEIRQSKLWAEIYH